MAISTEHQETREEAALRILGHLSEREVYSSLADLAASESQEIQAIASILATIYARSRTSLQPVCE